jgi:hypothetical protein
MLVNLNIQRLYAEIHVNAERLRTRTIFNLCDFDGTR